MVRLLDRVDDRTLRGVLLRCRILSLEPPSLPPSRAGGGWVGCLSNKRGVRPRGLRCIPFIPTQSPSRVNRGRSGDKWMRRRGRWLRKSSSDFMDQGCQQRSVLKTRDSAHAFGALARVLWGMRALALADGHSSCEVVICGRSRIG